MANGLNEDLLEKINYIKLRGSYVHIDTNELISSIHTLDDYKEFLNTIDFTLYHDRYFFVLRNFSSKTLTIMKECSIKLSTKCEVRQRENNIIGDINILNLEIDLDDRKEEYYDVEKNLRLKLPQTEQEIYKSMASDYSVLYNITKAMYDNKPIEDLEYRQFLESTEFFLTSVPELYSEYPDLIKLSIDYVKKIPITRDYKINMAAHQIKKKLKTYK